MRKQINAVGLAIMLAMVMCVLITSPATSLEKNVLFTIFLVAEIVFIATADNQ